MVEALAEQKIGHANKHEEADDTITKFERLIANCSYNLEDISDPFNVILEDNKIDISNFLI